MVLVPVVAIGAMVGAFLALRGVGALLHRVVSAERLESLVRVDVREGLVGALVAVATVWSASRVSGVARRWVAVIVYAAGAALAWLALNDWDFPEWHARAYDPSAVPLSLTWAGGALAVAAEWWAARGTGWRERTAGAGSAL